jgi:hypothetical protein
VTRSITMFVQLTAALRQIGARRAVSVLCAVTVLVFTFVHATHHRASADVSPLQIELAALDGSSGDPDKSPAPEHCCNCSTAGMIVAVTALLVAAPVARLEAAVRPVPRPNTPAADFRPPIA